MQVYCCLHSEAFCSVYWVYFFFLHAQSVQHPRWFKSNNSWLLVKSLLMKCMHLCIYMPIYAYIYICLSAAQRTSSILQLGRIPGHDSLSPISTAVYENVSLNTTLWHGFSVNCSFGWECWPDISLGDPYEADSSAFFIPHLVSHSSWSMAVLGFTCGFCCHLRCFFFF